MSTWFEWLGGSTLVNWKWHDFSKKDRDGFLIYLLSDPQSSSRKISKASIPSYPKLKSLHCEKLQHLLDTLCVENGFVRWDIRFFSVLKGESDIRLVFDGTRNGLNSITWAPSFFLPTSTSLARILQPNTYQLDMDVGEMFLNFPLRNNIRPYCGVNLTNFNDLGITVKERRQRWTRLWFGFKLSPYLAVR